MNRRDAIAALVGLPGITRIATASPAPTDVIVVECDQVLSIEGKARMREHLTTIWPGRKIVICDRGTRIKLMAE